jgi:hypothetical protein
MSIFIRCVIQLFIIIWKLTWKIFIKLCEKESEEMQSEKKVHFVASDWQRFSITCGLNVW